MRTPNRSTIWREDDAQHWWRWTCGWSTCTRGGTDRSHAAVLGHVLEHCDEHASFGFRTPPTRR